MKRIAASACLLFAATFAGKAVATPLPPDAQPAAETGGGAGAGTGPNQGRTGQFQLFLQAPPIVVDQGQSGRGFAVNQSIFPGGSSYGSVGITGGLGYVLTSLFEVGGAMTFSYVGGNEDAVDFELEPFVKLNLGPTLQTGAINPFVLGGFGLGVASVGNGEGGTTSFGIFSLDLDPGVEWLFGGNWGVDAYVPIQIKFSTVDHGQVGFTFGVAYGLVGYL